jgi:hypothetical protein
MQVWCKDFIGDPKSGRPATCCTKDQEISLTWCKIAANRQHESWPAVCDPWHPHFGSQNWVVDVDGGLRISNGLFANETKDESGFCEVLGKVRAPRRDRESKGSDTGVCQRSCPLARKRVCTHIQSLLLWHHIPKGHHILSASDVGITPGGGALTYSVCKNVEQICRFGCWRLSSVQLCGRGGCRQKMLDPRQILQG